MPAIKIYSKTLETNLKDAIAGELLAIMQQSLKVPIVEVFFFGLEKVYATDGREHCLLEIEGPDRPAETIEQLGRALCKCVENHCGENSHASAVYHPNAPETVLESEGSLVTMMRNRNPSPTQT